MAGGPIKARRVLLTGGTGFIGANLARHLVAGGHRVTLLVRPERQTWRLADITDSVLYEVVDLGAADQVTAVVERVRPEWVFHLAAHGAYSWQNDASEIVRTNYLATANLAQACVRYGVEGFVHAGSSSEYGYKDHAAQEDEYLEPASLYAATKAGATLLCKQLGQERGCRMRTLRLYSAYGPYEEPGRLIPALVRYGLAGRLPNLVDPRVARDFVYVDDVCDAFVRAASESGGDPTGVYNVGSEIQTSIEDAVQSARLVMQVEAEPAWGSMPNRSWDTNVWVSNCARIRGDLGWQSKHTFEQGLGLTVEWFRAHPELWERYPVT